MKYLCDAILSSKVIEEPFVVDRVLPKSSFYYHLMAAQYFLRRFNTNIIALPFCSFLGGVNCMDPEDAEEMVE